MERADGGDLHSKLNDAQCFVSGATVNATKAYLVQLIGTLLPLAETVRFTHFDLHLRNILLVTASDGDDMQPPVLRYDVATDAALFVDTVATNGLVCKLTDFGLSYVHYTNPRAGVHFATGEIVTVLNNTGVFRSAYMHRKEQPASTAVHAYNPSFDLQRLALSLLARAVEFDALWRIDMDLLLLLRNMLNKDVSNDPVASVQLKDAHRNLNSALTRLLTLRGTFQGIGVKLEAQQLQISILGYVETLFQYAFTHIDDYYPTPRTVIQTTPWLAVQAQLPRVRVAAITKDRIVHNMSLRVGDHGAATLPPIFAAP
jgi:hypothetical protein